MNKTLTTLFAVIFSFSIIAFSTEPAGFHSVAQEMPIVVNSTSPVGELLSFAPTFGERIASFNTHILIESLLNQMPKVSDQASVITFNPQPIEIISDVTVLDQWTPSTVVEVNTLPAQTITLSSSPVIVNAPAPVQTTTAVVETTPVQTKTLKELVQNFTIQDTSNSLSDGEEKHVQQLLATMFQKFPRKFTSPLKNLTLKVATDGPRGLAGSNTMILRVNNMKDSELVGVAIHELGHIVDLGYLVGRGNGTASAFLDGDTEVSTDDVSSEFYAISWKNSKDKISSNNEGFVSGYANSDPFEDFAETFNYYVLHADEFKNLAKGNAQLAKKYEFMKNKVFDGEEFTQGTSKKSYTSFRPWDTTVLPYDWEWYQGVSF